MRYVALVIPGVSTFRPPTSGGRMIGRRAPWARHDEDAEPGPTPWQRAVTPTIASLERNGRVASIDVGREGHAVTLDMVLASLVGRDAVIDPVGHAACTVLGERHVGPVAAAARASAADAAAAAAADRDGRTVMWLDLVNVEGDVLRARDAATLTDDEGSALFASLAPVVTEMIAGASLHVRGGHRALLDVGTAIDPSSIVLHPPEAFEGRSVLAAQPTGDGARVVRRLTEALGAILVDHEINVARVEAGFPPLATVWPWGAGVVRHARSFADRYDGLEGVVVADDAVSLGFGARFGMRPRRVSADRPPGRGASDPAPDPTARLEALARAVGDEVRAGRCVMAVVPSPPAEDEGPSEHAIEAIDQRVIGPIIEALEADASSGWRVLIALGPSIEPESAHPAPGPIVSLLAGHGMATEAPRPFDERSAYRANLHVRPGDDVLEYVLFGAGVRRLRKRRRSRSSGSPPSTVQPGSAETPPSVHPESSSHA